MAVTSKPQQTSWVLQLVIIFWTLLYNFDLAHFYAIPREIPESCDFVTAFLPFLLLKGNYFILNSRKKFQFGAKSRGGEFGELLHCVVEIAEILCHTFFAKISWKQWFTKEITKLSSWFDDFFFQWERISSSSIHTATVWKNEKFTATQIIFHQINL